MGTTIYNTILILCTSLVICSAEVYNVRIVSEEHVNLVDSRFISFTIDPSYFFSSGKKYNGKECICMASALTPAYLRIAGPSTSHMTFHNATISFEELDEDHNDDLEVIALDTDTPEKEMLEKAQKLAVTHRDWRKFIYWAKTVGFDLVFALNNHERTSSGMWDPNTALNILTVAEKANVGDLFWELGYECTNQSIDEYLNDLETLRIVVGTFPLGRTGQWRVVGGDVTKCLQVNSKSDFKDYVTASNEMMDALLLNGNSSSHELERMTDSDRLKLVRLLSYSNTPLWLTENNQRRYNQLERAADWLASLGYGAKNGFSVHYRELEEEEMYEPTLSFYMALLFKNLVGERVLNVEMEPTQAILFAHCTSLRQKPVAGAMTLFAVNMDAEPARFSLKLAKREEGGEIMQFILGHDHSGNIVVNGRAMYYEGDIRPVVKHVRPYKTLLINLPPKSFGFWVLANTKIEACQYVEEGNTNLNETDNVSNDVRVKRSINDDFEDDYEDNSHTANLTYDFDEIGTISSKALENRIVEMNKDLGKLLNAYNKQNKLRFKRSDDGFGFTKFWRKNAKLFETDLNPKEYISDLWHKAKESVGSLKDKSLGFIKKTLYKNKVNKRHSKTPRRNIARLLSKRAKAQQLKKSYIKKGKFTKKSKDNKIPTKLQKYGSTTKKQMKEISNEITSKVNDKPKQSVENKMNVDKQDSIENEILKEDITELKSRKRRQVVKDTEELSVENDNELEASNELDGNNKAKLWKILRNIHKDLKDLSSDNIENVDESDEGIIVNTELTDDTATIKLKDPSKGAIGNTMKKVANALEELNDNLKKFWHALSLLN